MELDELYWFLEYKPQTGTRENVYIMTMVSRRARRSRYFPRKLENLQAVLAVFVQAYNHFELQKEHYRSRHSGATVPFSLFDFL